MTASCPKCGGKWDREGTRPKAVGRYFIGSDENTHFILVPCGDRLEVLCHYCNTTMSYPLSIEDEKKLFIEREVKLYEIIEKLERQLKTAKEKLI